MEAQSSTVPTEAVEVYRGISNILIRRRGENMRFRQTIFVGLVFAYFSLYRVYKKKRNLGISQEIDIVLRTKDFRCLGI
jgi:hypothetical protein